ncbi:hypothetical protein RNZ50_06330 [Paracoccaceae bacterium Fryx2]|nr:hypothetical protein [Paracoccaceae bacterium Fryx2]
MAAVSRKLLALLPRKNCGRAAFSCQLDIILMLGRLDHPRPHIIARNAGGRTRLGMAQNRAHDQGHALTRIKAATLWIVHGMNVIPYRKKKRGDAMPLSESSRVIRAVFRAARKAPRRQVHHRLCFGLESRPERVVFGMSALRLP